MDERGVSDPIFELPKQESIRQKCRPRDLVPLNFPLPVRSSDFSCFPPLSMAAPIELIVRKESLHYRTVKNRGQPTLWAGQASNVTTKETLVQLSSKPELPRKSGVGRPNQLSVGMHQCAIRGESITVDESRSAWLKNVPLRRKSKSERQSMRSQNKASAEQRASQETPFRPKLPKKRVQKGEKDEQRLKLRGYIECLFLLRLDSRITVQAGSSPYKAFVGEGNNSGLIKCCLKTRPWWVMTSSPEGSHFMWTEWKKKPLLDRLPLDKLVQSQASDIEDCLLTKQKAIQLQGWLLPSTVQAVSGMISDSTSFYLKGKFKKGVAQQQVWLKQSKVQTRKIESSTAAVYNHLQGGLYLHHKKSILKHLSARYDALGKPPPFPPTFHIGSVQDESYIKFQQAFQTLSSKVWILKPGENSNQGHGIQVSDSLQEIRDFVERMQRCQHSVIVQHYLNKPMLYKKRKFDIRCYLLVTSFGECLKGYWYEECYARTSSRDYSLADLSDRMAHLTNDAVQKKFQTYGKHEPFNKVSLQDLLLYLQQEKKVGFKQVIIPQMRQIAKQLLQSVGRKLDPQRRKFTFQLFGLDFMLKQDGEPVLIEANSNPCLDTSGPVLGRLIPQLIENVLRVGVDPLFPMSEAGLRKYPGYDLRSTRFTLIHVCK